MNINNHDPLMILGNTDSGKTNLMFYFASLLDKDRKVYMLGYPKAIRNYQVLHSVDDLSKIHDCVVLIDELARYFPVWEKKTNTMLFELLQFAAHNNIKIIATTQITQSITKQLEAFIGQWAIKQIRMSSLKNGSMPKNILKTLIKHPNITSEVVKIGNDEFVWYNERGAIGENGILRFPNQNINKDWSIKKTE